MSKKVIGIGFIMACLVLFGSCKPKQSAYKSVYEAAKERELEENKNTLNTSVSSPKTTPSYNTTPNPYTPVTTNETVRKEKLTPATETDASNLRAYSVVVAAMALRPSAESLKERLSAEGYNIILALNEQNMYRVIIASCDTKEEAVARKNQILSDFTSKSDLQTLKSKFGIPFNDWWILQREY